MIEATKSPIKFFQILLAVCKSRHRREYNQKNNSPKIDCLAKTSPIRSVVRKSEEKINREP
jgi:hypothetical protein